MTKYEKSLYILEELFARDYQFALATSNDNIPSVRFVDTFYDDCAFYIVTYAKSKKVKDIEKNPEISMCNKLYRFSGIARNIGHPLLEENHAIRQKLIEVFEPWYFAHNDENDENMCYVKIELKQGFFYKEDIGYKVDFEERKAEEFPFKVDIID
ncbi:MULTISPECIES: pyridoxamine 5'-phosphate oxidase family protein [unclassified Sedimentibacter]|uniref:pyridoxamine 5'-phosphate oxidase family protein n=1 Tax=unclassified Sedimentibacter TaxID=2649220 RepID=UPI0027DFC466|nr:pyridoxamine 5'-phosphate oxidase family protein [Sedimentibacter sp. MB35-C1]WMJ77298.1 pyridoxamine 5'-phosphate oxidase family protein [Sedimentibacter sp. MB35-C1]